MNTWLTQIRQFTEQAGFKGFLPATVTLGAGLSFVVPFISLWGTQEIGFSSFGIGIFTAMTSLSGVVAAIALSRWSDTRVSRRTILMIGSGCGALGYGSYAFIRDPSVLIIVSLPMVALSSICFSQVFALARDWFINGGPAAKEPAILLSIVRVCFSLAWVIGPIIGATIYTHSGFEGLFSGAGILYLLFFTWVFLCVPNEVRLPGQTYVAGKISVWATICRRDILGYVMVFSLVFSAFALNMLNLPLAVIQRFGGTVHAVGFISGIGPFVEIPLMLWFGHLAARGQTSNLLRLGVCSSALYFGFLCLATEVWHLYLAQILNGLSHAILANVTITFLQGILPSQPGLASAIFSSSASVGNLVGYFSFGLLSHVLGPRGLFAVCLFATLVACAALAILHPRSSSSKLDV
ncbi:MAG: MFS transporter [Nibricoccus sp.]